MNAVTSDSASVTDILASWGTSAGLVAVAGTAVGDAETMATFVCPHGVFADAGGPE